MTMTIEDGVPPQKKIWRNRWFVAVVVAVVVVLIVVIALLIGLLYNKGGNFNTIEWTSEKTERTKKAFSRTTENGRERAFKELIMPGWKTEADPCKDFYEYACGKMEGSTLWERSATEMEELKTGSLQKVLTQEVSSLTDSKALQNVYQHMKNFMLESFPEGDTKLHEATRLVDELGGTPLIPGNGYYRRPRNILQTLVKLQKLTGLQPLIDFKKIKDLLDPNESALSIQINLKGFVMAVVSSWNFTATKAFASHNLYSRPFDNSKANSLREYYGKISEKGQQNETSNVVEDYFNLKDIQAKREKETHFTAEQIKEIWPELEETLRELFQNVEMMKKTKFYAFLTWAGSELRLPLSLQLIRKQMTVLDKKNEQDDMDLTQAVLVEAALGIFYPANILEGPLSYKSSILESAMGLPFVNLVARRMHQFKEKTEDTEFMIHMIRETFTHRISESNWMSTDGKQIASEKLNHIKTRIFLPEILEDQTEFANYYKDFPEPKENQNLMELAQVMATFELDQQFKDLDRPTKYEPFLSDEMAFMANAMYDPTGNSINILLGIQAPIIDLEYPLMMKFAGLGMIIGHELTHGFDINGQNFDLHGTLRPWMPEDDFTSFKARASCFIHEYDKLCWTDYFGISEQCVGGRISQGETMADDGGIRLAHAAYKSISAKFPELAAQDKLAELGSLSQDQQFFLGYASLWCDRERPPPPTDDPHPPGWARIQGTLKNYPPFSEAFQCKLGTEMNPEEKCQVW